MPDEDPWTTHLLIMRHIVHARWDELRGMSLQQRADDDSFCHFAIEQHLAHFVVGRMTAAQQTGLLPERWIQTLQTEVTRRRDARRVLREQLANVAAALSKAGLDYRVLKGIPFAQKYLGDVNLRRSADIDLLVREQDVDRALGVLWDLGYIDKTQCVRMTKNGPAIKASMLRKQHELTVENGEIQIDLHWRLRTAPAYQWNDSKIWAQRDEISALGVNYPVLTDEYALVLLLVSTAHDIARGGCRLKHLLDVYHLLCCQKTHIDWPSFLENRKAENTLKISVNMLMIMLDVWGEEGDLPQLKAALAPYPGLQTSDAGESRALELVRSPRGGVENKLWFAQVYGVRFRRDAVWILRRTLRYPRRWPMACWRVVRWVLPR